MYGPTTRYDDKTPEEINLWVHEYLGKPMDRFTKAADYCGNAIYGWRVIVKHKIKLDHDNLTASFGPVSRTNSSMLRAAMETFLIAKDKGLL